MVVNLAMNHLLLIVSFNVIIVYHCLYFCAACSPCKALRDRFNDACVDENTRCMMLSSACSSFISQETETEVQYHTLPAVTVTPSCPPPVYTTVFVAPTITCQPQPFLSFTISHTTTLSPAAEECPTITCQPQALLSVTTSPNTTALPAVSDTATATCNTDSAIGDTATGSDSGLAVLGAFTALLATLLVIVTMGWIYTCVVNRRRDKATAIRYTHEHCTYNTLVYMQPHTHTRTLHIQYTITLVYMQPHTHTSLKHTYSSKVDNGTGLHNPIYGAEETHDDQSAIHYSTQGPDYERVDIDNNNGYDVIDRRVPRPQSVSHAYMPPPPS